MYGVVTCGMRVSPFPVPSPTISIFCGVTLEAKHCVFELLPQISERQGNGSHTFTAGILKRVKEMATSLDGFRESLFGVFYIMTEQNNQHSKSITLGALRRCILYLIDAGQVVKAIFLPEFGWDPGVEKIAKKFDFFALIFDVVSTVCIERKLTARV